MFYTGRRMAGQSHRGWNRAGEVLLPRAGDRGDAFSGWMLGLLENFLCGCSDGFGFWVEALGVVDERFRTDAVVYAKVP